MPFGRLLLGYGAGFCGVEASGIVCHGYGCSVSLHGGFLLSTFAILIPGCDLALSPEAGAG